MKKLILLFSVLFLFSCSSEPIKYTLTTNAIPNEGGTVSPVTKQYNEGETASITATPAAEYVFESWTGATGSSSATSIVMSSDKSITANFIKKKYTLTVNTEGEGTVNQKVIKTGSATDYNSGSVIELTATANSPWSFNQWDGDLTGTDNPKQITIDKNKTVTAIFENLINSYKIYVTSSSSADYNLTGKDRDGDVSGKDPDLTFSVGDQVTFIVDATPFYLKTIAGIGTGNQIDVSNNGTGNGSIIWVPKAAGTYYYQCELHSEMVGTITIQN